MLEILDYNQMYNFALNNYHKLQIILVIKDFWKSKSNKVHVKRILNGSLIVKPFI